MNFQVRIRMQFRPGIKDNQGQAVRHALNTMGFDSVEGVRIGRVVDMNFEASSREEAETIIDDMCQKSLVNTIMENYEIEFMS